MFYSAKELVILATKLEEMANASLLKTAKLDPKAKTRNRGNVVFPANSTSVNDGADHFPINNEAQARNALARANQYSSAPDWYKGSLKSLVEAVARKVHAKYPGIKLSPAAKKPGKN